MRPERRPRAVRPAAGPPSPRTGWPGCRRSGSRPRSPRRPGPRHGHPAVAGRAPPAWTRPGGPPPDRPAPAAGPRGGRVRPDSGAPDRGRPRPRRRTRRPHPPTVSRQAGQATPPAGPPAGPQTGRPPDRPASCAARWGRAGRYAPLWRPGRPCRRRDGYGPGAHRTDGPAAGRRAGAAGRTARSSPRLCGRRRAGPECRCRTGGGTGRKAGRYLACRGQDMETKNVFPASKDRGRAKRGPGRLWGSAGHAGSLQFAGRGRAASLRKIGCLCKRREDCPGTSREAITRFHRISRGGDDGRRLHPCFRRCLVNGSIFLLPIRGGSRRRRHLCGRFPQGIPSELFVSS